MQKDQTTIEHIFLNLTFVNQKLNFNNYFLNLQKELKQLKNDYHLAVKTIYIATNDSIFLLDQQLISILSLIEIIIDSNLIEYSFEVGYQTLTSDQLVILKKFKVNRLVWKIRTFNQRILTIINQNFDLKTIFILFRTSLKFGFNNYSFDLVDNLPQQSNRSLLRDLDIALIFNPVHISYQSYDDEYSLANKKLISKFLVDHNYINYEFFSFALNHKYYSQQTLAYLQLKNWYGLGPNSASFIVSKTKVITINNDHNWQQEIRTLNQKEYLQTLIIQGLMLQSGFKLENEGLLAFNSFLSTINQLIDEDKMVVGDNYLRLTSKGWTLLNDVLIDIINS